MNVAIMGAGLSGLACAITLERNGITPVIYEKRSQVGDRFINAEAFMNVLTRPITDPIHFFMERHQINIKPVSHIRTLHIFSENEQAKIEGHIGFVNIRGRHHLSFEQQLANQLQTPIHFHSTCTYEELLHEHSHVIMATGDGAYTEKLQPYEKNTTACLTGATVEGNFDRYTVMVWLDHRFAPKGYGYLLPFSDKEANIVVAYPDNIVRA
ncbi:NAD(P)-binding protein, partial [Bacillus sp. FJAT-47783]|uniref:NAD(P)/FAD-dependent oxidoreductase n=1 Tax=Bacillus sp. FJAT-47783 TaxID=2922712 RepID=UPI001FABF6E5